MSDLILNAELVEDRSTAVRSLYMGDVYEVVEKVLKIDPATQLAVIQKCGPLAKSYNIGVKTQEIWNQLQLEKRLGQNVRLTSGSVVVIQRAFERYDEVTVKNVPPYWGADKVERILGFYGNVHNIRHETMRFTVTDCRPAYNGIWNGNWKIKMKIRRSVPSNLVIQGNRIELFHRNQRKTCYKCGMDHFIRDCETSPSEYINRFTLEDFPTIETKSVIDIGEERQETDVNNEERNDEMTVDTDPNAIIPAREVEPDIVQERGDEPATILDSEVQQMVQEINETEGNSTRSSGMEESNDVSDLQTINVVAEVLHSDSSQEVRGALPSPVHKEDSEGTDTAITETASEDGQHDIENVESGSQITPGQRQEIVTSQIDSQQVDEKMESQQLIGTPGDNQRSGQENEIGDTVLDNVQLDSQQLESTTRVLSGNVNLCELPNSGATTEQQRDIGNMDLDTQITTGQVHANGSMELDDQQLDTKESQQVEGETGLQPGSSLSQMEVNLPIGSNRTKRDKPDLQSSTDESDPVVIKVATGSFVSSLFNSYTSFRKKKKGEDVCDE